MASYHLRIARPVSDLQRSCDLYRQGLDLEVIAEFSQHQGFSGYMLGRADLSWHLELTLSHHHPVKPSPTHEDLLVLYIPEKNAWDAACDKIRDAGFRPVPSFNPYWEVAGATFEDPDGYRVVLQNRAWPACSVSS